MTEKGGDGVLVPDTVIADLLKACPELADHLDPSEGSYYNLGVAAVLLSEGRLAPADQDLVFAHLNRIGSSGDKALENLLVVGVLEILADTDASIERARSKLDGAALMLFERVIKGWKAAD